MNSLELEAIVCAVRRLEQTQQHDSEDIKQRLQRIHHIMSLIANALKEVAANSTRLHEAFITYAQQQKMNGDSLNQQLQDLNTKLQAALAATDPDLAQAVQDVTTAMSQENDRAQQVMASLLAQASGTAPAPSPAPTTPPESPPAGSSTPQPPVATTDPASGTPVAPPPAAAAA